MFKYTAIIAFALLAIGSVNAQDAPEKAAQNTKGTVKITITNVQSEDGNLIVEVFTSEDAWLEEGESLTKISVPVKENLKDASVSAELSLPFGEYALYMFQDRDKNNELKTNWIGIPREPVATSNNAKGRMGPPKFKDAKFTLDNTEVAMSVKLTDL